MLTFGGSLGPGSACPAKWLEAHIHVLKETFTNNHFRSTKFQAHTLASSWDTVQFLLNENEPWRTPIIIL